MGGFANIIGKENSADNPLPRGSMYPIACMTWFTSNGEAIPIMFKYTGDDGTIQKVSDIKVVHAEDKKYAGMASRYYECIVTIGGLKHEIALIYYKDTNSWVMTV